PLVGISDIRKLPAGKKMLANYRDRSLDFSFVLCPSYARRVGHETIMPFQVSVRMVNSWIVEIGLYDTRLEIIQNHPLHHPMKKFEGPNVTVDPCRRVLAENKAYKSMPAMGKRHDETPGLAIFSRFGVSHSAHIPKIHLRLVSRRSFQMNRCLRPAQIEL